MTRMIWGHRHRQLLNYIPNKPKKPALNSLSVKEFTTMGI